AGDAVKEFIANRLADDHRAGVGQLLNGARGAARRWMRLEPFRVAAAGPFAGDVVHVLDGRSQPRQPPLRGAGNRTCKVVRDKRRLSHCLIGHVGPRHAAGAALWPRYQSRIVSPSHATTPLWLRISPNARSTWRKRCGAPER